LFGAFSLIADDIKKQLRPHRIQDRASTLTTAFAQAIAPNEKFDHDRVLNAFRDLNQNPVRLICVFCGKPATTWDHLIPLVIEKHFSGYGQWLGNLVPSCAECNASKRRVDWHYFLATKVHNNQELRARTRLLERYVKNYGRRPISQKTIDKLCPTEMRRLNALKESIFDRMKEADQIADKIRHKLNSI
jgi:hypothetical protein